jgi:hypothetical protein
MYRQPSSSFLILVSIYLARPIRFLERKQGRVLGMRMSIETQDAMKQSVTKSKETPTAPTHK